MNRLLLLLENKRNQDLLAQWLATHYEVLSTDADQLLLASFDLCILDGPTLNRIWTQVQARKVAEQPVFLPFILITSLQEVDLLTRHLWKTTDELIRLPIEKMELQARVEMLLRARRLSLDLKLRNEDLESFIHAMTHDLRAPLRAVSGFAQALDEDERERLNPTSLSYLTKIQEAAGQMRDLIDALVGFSRINREEIQLQHVALDQIVEESLQQVQHDIAVKHAQVMYTPVSLVVVANPVLLKMTLTNLLSNALKFVAQNVQPVITIAAHIKQGYCRITVQDNGIGISPRDQARLFSPFVQLHGEETYPGIGLGLATVRKAVTLMHGQVGIESSPDSGSIFWVDLPAVEEVKDAHSSR